MKRITVDFKDEADDAFLVRIAQAVASLLDNYQSPVSWSVVKHAEFDVPTPIAQETIVGGRPFMDAARSDGN